MARSFLKPIIILVGAAFLTGTLFLSQLLINSSPTFTRLENIHGIRFPETNGQIDVTEKLAHLDIELSEPVFAQELVLKINFIPLETEELYVGVRENSFWLSYPWQQIFPGEVDLIIPLTDKLQDTDRTIDLMFLAGPKAGLANPDLKNQDTTHWQLVSLTASVRPAIPTLPQIKNYLASLLKRERPL